MRYFLEFAYNGTRFCGYQEQPGERTVQSTIEEALATLLRTPTKIVGCGRTDTGVHALQYYAHFDSNLMLNDAFLYKMNSLVGTDIVFYNLIPVHEDAHARFDATSRSYEYVIDIVANPFRQETAFFCKYAASLDIAKMQEAAQLLLEYTDFETFCKTHTDTKTKLCTLCRSVWIFDNKQQQLIYHVTADRFLRGMIRLIVGMCLNVGRGQLSLEEVREALEQQQPLKKALSAPAKGLFLKDIKYEYIIPNRAK